MQPLRLANIFRVVGAGFFLFGIYYKMYPIWLFGLAVMIFGSVWRIIIKSHEAKSSN